MLIDANVWSELTRREPAPLVVGFLDTNRDRVFLSTIVMAELEFGIANADDAARRARLGRFADMVLERCEGRVLAPDLETAAVWGRLKASLNAEGKRVEDIDLLICAQAIAAGLPLVTRNVAHMERTGAVIINPWEA